MAYRFSSPAARGSSAPISSTALLEQGVDVRVLDNLSTGSLRNLQASPERGLATSRAGRGRRIELMIGDVRDERAACARPCGASTASTTSPALPAGHAANGSTARSTP